VTDLGLAPSYLTLCLVQALLVLAPIQARPWRRLVSLGALVPPLALGIGVLVLRVFSAGPDSLALLGAVATPILAASVGWLLGWRRRWLSAVLAAVLYALAWQLQTLGGEAAGLALIGLACVAIAAAVAAITPRRSIELGLVLLAVLDVVLVWGTPQVGPATTALAHASQPRLSLPLLPPHPLPALQDATFGSASMGWLDLLAPALLAATLSPRSRPAAAVATAIAAAAWGVLLFFTSPIPATVPVVAVLLASRLQRRLVDRARAAATGGAQRAG
jgi:hypothetical protein